MATISKRTLADALLLAAALATSPAHAEMDQLVRDAFALAESGQARQACDMLDAVLRLGQDADALTSLRARLVQARSGASVRLPGAQGTAPPAGARVNAPLFDHAARVREWEAAWTTLVQRHHAGQQAPAFDVPEQVARAATATLSRPAAS